MPRKHAFAPGGSKFRLRYVNFRNACIRYIRQNGPKTSAHLMENIRNRHGAKYGMAPKNTASLSMVLLRDNRFVSHEDVKEDKGPVRLWSVVDDAI